LKLAPSRITFNSCTNVFEFLDFSCQLVNLLDSNSTSSPPIPHVFGAWRSQARESSAYLSVHGGP
jgi:hypothetical protein